MGRRAADCTAITLKTSEGIMRLTLRDVVFTETSRNNYQLIHTIQGKTLEARMTASELFELLSQNKFFVRCGVSLNLNLKYIRQISKDAITFDTGERLAYPYRAYPKLKEEFLRFQMSAEDSTYLTAVRPTVGLRMFPPLFIIKAPSICMRGLSCKIMILIPTAQVFTWRGSRLLSTCMVVK
jgi:hypothetical protein